MLSKAKFSPSLVFAALIGVLVLVSPSCDGTPCVACAGATVNAADGSYVTILNNTCITCGAANCPAVGATHIPLDKLPDQGCLPCSPESEAVSGCEATAITAIDVTPDGCSFAPDATLSFLLPSPYPAGYDLFIYQNVPGAACPGAWVSASSVAAEVRNTQDFADGPFNHTTIFALVDLKGTFNALGRLTTPFEGKDGEITFGLRVTGSSTNPELKGKTVTFILAGVEPKTDAAQLNKLFEVGSTLLLHHETRGRLTIWSRRDIFQFRVEKIGW